MNEITHYGEEQLKKLKALFSSNLHNNPDAGKDMIRNEKLIL